MGQFRTSRTFDVVFVLILVGLLSWATLNRTAVGDWVFFTHYEPTAKTVQVADAAGLSAEGRRLFYRTDPQFTNAAVVAAQCDTERLGCLNSHRQVFILDDPAKPAQTIVTAAHEMLHLAYSRLSQAKKDKLAPLINQAIAQNEDSGIEDELRDTTTPEDRLDEAHSLLGTEYKALPSALEQYYTSYFTNRSKIVAAETASER